MRCRRELTAFETLHQTGFLSRNRLSGSVHVRNCAGSSPPYACKVPPDQLRFLCWARFVFPTLFVHNCASLRTVRPPAVAASDALEAAFEQLRQREAQASALEAQQDEALKRLAQWQAEVGSSIVRGLNREVAKWLLVSLTHALLQDPLFSHLTQEAELAAAQQEVAELERRLFGSPAPGTPEASQERQLALLDALCAMEAPSEVDTESSEEGSSHQVMRVAQCCLCPETIGVNGSRQTASRGWLPPGDCAMPGAPFGPSNQQQNSRTSAHACPCCMRATLPC